MASMSLLGIYRFGIRLSNRLFSIFVRGSFYRFGKGSTIQLPASIWGEASISIGENVHVGPGSWLHCLAGETAGDFPVIQIGDGCSFAGSATITAVSGICIEDEVLFGKNVHISDHAHEFSLPDQPVLRQGISNVKPVRICQGAWLGQGVVVCPGVTIGRNCVIGANSVVKSDIPDYCVAVGAPARIIRRLKD